MTALSVDQALENIYQSLHDSNRDIDTHIAQLKNCLKAANQSSVNVDPVRLSQNNRQGRKMMQSYFRQRGVVVNFKE